MTNSISSNLLPRYRQQLIAEEKSPGTIAKYLRDASVLIAFLDGRPATKESLILFKQQLMETRAKSTVNAMLVAVNHFLSFAGKSACRVKLLKTQRSLFREDGQVLSREEYLRLVSAAEGLARPRLALLLQAICATGIRVSEVRYLTVEASRAGKVEISMKGKIRVILLPPKLCRMLLRYARQKKIAAGEIFLTRSGKSLDRRQIWKEMKSLCRTAGVAPSKVFPHNLRHLFARCFYHACRDLVKLADVLGHSSVETTRIYLIETGREHIRHLNQLRLLC